MQVVMKAMATLSVMVAASVVQAQVVKIDGSSTVYPITRASPKTFRS